MNTNEPTVASNPRAPWIFAAALLLLSGAFGYWLAGVTGAAAARAVGTQTNLSL
ncbi:MAG: hypothetical protein AAF411_19725 [Myxococcota bacterium]